MSKQKCQTAIITGASGSIGALYADRLAKRGMDVVLVGRNHFKLAAVADHIARTHGRTAEVLVADLLDSAAVEDVAERMQDKQVRMLVNAAGVGLTSTALDVEPNAVADMIQLNVVALSSLCLAAGAAFASRGRGGIVNVGSISAVMPEILNGSYSGASAFALNFSRSLNTELDRLGVRVQIVLAGIVATNFWDEAGKPLDEIPPGLVMEPDHFVDAALVGFDAGEVVTIPSLPNELDWLNFEWARQAMLPNLTSNVPACRYFNIPELKH